MAEETVPGVYDTFERDDSTIEIEWEQIEP